MEWVPFDVLLTFSAAAFAIVVIPGPTILLVTGYALSSGRRAALLCILGVCLGDISAMTLTFLGLGAVLAASATLFSILKWCGAAYLVFLGIQLWRAQPEGPESTVRKDDRPLKIVARAFTANILHPKGLAFYAAFMPQFIDSTYPAGPQMLILGAAFASIACLVLLVYALAAGRFRAAAERPAARRLFNRSGACCLIGAGVYTASLTGRN